ncbi:MAG: hypothetical protein IPN51_07890 [Chloracidobacterium sp.]|nr:hypothetical protein [Chloracidobacterium sp.]
MKLKLPFLLILVLSLFAAANAQGQWKEFKSAKENFSVLVPCEIESSTENVGTPENPQLQTYFECSADSIYYNVSVTMIPKGPADDDTLLEAFQNGLIEGMNSTLISGTSAKSGTAPGRSFQASAKLGAIDGLMDCRIYKKDGKMYSLTSAVAVTNKSPDREKFLASFKFIK